MDYFGTDRKLSELGEQDLDDFLDQDMFTPPLAPVSDVSMDHFGLDNTTMDTVDSGWLDNFFDDPVLNDRMMTDALQPRRVQSEHSYSLTNGEKITLEGQIKLEPTEKGSDFDDFLNNAINPNMTLTTVATTLHNSTCPTQMATSNMTDMSMNQQMITSCTSDSEIAMAVSSIETQPQTLAALTRTSTHPQTLLKQPTIILATQESMPAMSSMSSVSSLSPLVNSVKQERLVLPKVNIKVEPYDTASNLSSPEHATMYDSIGLPPTPPSSSNSDSDGSLSPQRSAPPSPVRHSHQLLRQHVHTTQTLGGASAALSHPTLFTSPIPTSGILILSDEEKRTLITEGYPIPNKLPLTKQEEKNLKKIRRKIKNKISAQESRRKKKEYLETLEKKVESYNSENCDLKKKVEQLENNNRSLIGQLHKLQALVAKVPRPSSPTTQTGTCLMVLVLFFAVFVGTWSPMTWSIGYSSIHTVPAAGSTHQPSPPDVPAGPSMGPSIQQPVSDPYSTPNIRSRVLLSTKDDQEEPYGPHVPFSYRDFFMRWFSSGMKLCPGNNPDIVMSSDWDFTVSPPTANYDREVELKVAQVLSEDMPANIMAQVMTPHVNTTA